MRLTFANFESLPDESVTEQPIFFLGVIFHGPQKRCSTIEKEEYTIYWAHFKLDWDTFYDSNGPPQPTLHE